MEADIMARLTSTVLRVMPMVWYGSGGGGL